MWKADVKIMLKLKLYLFYFAYSILVKHTPRHLLLQVGTLSSTDQSLSPVEQEPLLNRPIIELCWARALLNIPISELNCVYVLQNLSSTVQNWQIDQLLSKGHDVIRSHAFMKVLEIPFMKVWKFRNFWRDKSKGKWVFCQDILHILFEDLTGMWSVLHLIRIWLLERQWVV